MSTLNLDSETERQLQDLICSTGKEPLPIIRQALQAYRAAQPGDPLQQAWHEAPDAAAVSAEEKRLIDEAQQDVAAGCVSTLAAVRQRLPAVFPEEHAAWCERFERHKP